uniref:Uncharacterized protein n=1 Tax=Sphaerodactylus townsendi TaxID=933632 RepID=A0ACB8EXG1_9SAUR
MEESGYSCSPASGGCCLSLPETILVLVALTIVVQLGLKLASVMPLLPLVPGRDFMYGMDLLFRGAMPSSSERPPAPDSAVRGVIQAHQPGRTVGRAEADDHAPARTCRKLSSRLLEPNPRCSPRGRCTNIRPKGDGPDKSHQRGKQRYY